MSKDLPIGGAAGPGEGADRRLRLLPLLLLLAGALAYANSFDGPFLFDDYRGIVWNWRVREFSGRETVRPVAHLSFALHYAVGGLQVADIHAANLAIHLAAGLLLYGLTRRTLLLASGVNGWRAHATPIAFAVALLWVLHPLQTAAVTYMVQRIEALAGLFYLAALYGVARVAATDRRVMAVGWGLAAVLASWLGMATKEIVVTLPVVALAYDRIYCSGPGWGGCRRRAPLHVGLFAGWGVLWALHRFNPSRDDAPGGALLGPLEYLASQAGVIVRYLRLAVWPGGQVLDYAWPPAETAAAVLVPGIPLVALGVAAVVLLARRPALGFPACAFFVLLAPTSSVLPIADLAFEHRMYLPLAPLCALVVLGAASLLRRLLPGARWRGRRAILAWGALACVAALLGLTTAMRNRAYASEHTMWLDVLRKRPGNLRAYTGAADGWMRQDRPEDAIALCEVLLGRLPDLSALAAEDLPEEPAAGESANLVLVADVYVRARLILGQARFQQGDRDAAAAEYLEALRLRPRHPGALAQLGLVRFAQDRTEDALALWRQTLEAAPPRSQGEADAHAYLGHALFLGDAHGDALPHLLAALALQPQRLVVRHDLARLRAMSPHAGLRDGAEAVALATAVCEATQYRSPRALETLAAALAEAGQPAAAVRAVREAIRLAGETTPDGSAAEGGADPAELERQRLLYEAGATYSPPAVETREETDAHAMD